jgi:hypothetical protein
LARSPAAFAPFFRVRRVDEIEIAAFGSQIGHQAVVDPMRIDNDPAIGGPPQDFGEAQDRHDARRQLIELRVA